MTSVNYLLKIHPSARIDIFLLWEISPYLYGCSNEGLDISGEYWNLMVIFAALISSIFWNISQNTVRDKGQKEQYTLVIYGIK